VVAAGAVPIVLALVGTGTANAEPAQTQCGDPARAAGPARPEAQLEQKAQWPAADAPNALPYQGLTIPDNTKSSLQWSRPAPR